MVDEGGCALDRSDILRIMEEVHLGPAYTHGDDQVVFPLWGMGRAQWIQVYVSANGEYMRFCMSGLSWMPAEAETERRSKVMELLLDANFTCKLIKFGVDASDGEINMEVGIPVSKHELDPALFHRAMASIVHGIREYIPKIDAICGGDGPFSAKAFNPEPGDELQRLLDSLNLDDAVPDDKEAGDADDAAGQSAESPAIVQPDEEPGHPPTAGPEAPASARQSRRTKRPTDTGD
jgi:hypothetical protein